MLKKSFSLDGFSDFNMDEYGRILINNEELHLSISGAYLDNIVLGTDNGCHDNAGCSNDSCV